MKTTCNIERTAFLAAHLDRLAIAVLRRPQSAAEVRIWKVTEERT